MRVIQTVQTPTSGIREVSDLSSVSGIGASETTLITINNNAVLKQWENHGVPTHRLKGDGRLWVKILSATPTSPVAGDVWLELDGSLGTVLRFYDGSTVFTLTTQPPTGSLSLTAVTALLQGHAVRATGSGAAYANVTVDGAHQYRVVGLVQADTLLGDPVQVLTAGDIMSMSDWTLLTGAATLTVGSVYWLAASPGRYSLTPHADVASKIGVAVSTTRLLVQPELVVIS